MPAGFCFIFCILLFPHSCFETLLSDALCARDLQAGSLGMISCFFLTSTKIDLVLKALACKCLSFSIIIMHFALR